jgi:hypothetical protein
VRHYELQSAASALQETVLHEFRIHERKRTGAGGIVGYAVSDVDPSGLADLVNGIVQAQEEG